jgi:hypothetical protein
VGTPDLQVLNVTARQVHGADVAVLVTNGRLTAPAADVSPWQGPYVDLCPDRSFCRTFGGGEGRRPVVPGRPYSIVAVLEGREPAETASSARFAGPRRRRGPLKG